MKKNTVYDVITNRKVSDNIISDEEVLLSSKRGQNCPITLRRIHFIRKEDDKEIVLISNDLVREADELMTLYKQRWKIELFFKWVKQNLRIKRFLGTSENAVKTQVLVAMIAYLLLRLTKNCLPLNKLSLQQIARLISVNIFHKKSLGGLLLGVFDDIKTNRSIRYDENQLMVFYPDTSVLI